MNDNSINQVDSRRKKRLGEILLKAGLIDQETLDKALASQKKNGKKLGQILIESEVVSDIEIARVLAEQLQLKFVRIRDDETIPREITTLIPPDMAEKHLLVPLRIIDRHLTVAMANPLDQNAYTDLRFLTRMSADIVVTPRETFAAP